MLQGTLQWGQEMNLIIWKTSLLRRGRSDDQSQEETTEKYLMSIQEQEINCTGRQRRIQEHVDGVQI